MKLVQFWRNGAPALGLQTQAGIVDAAAEAARRGTTAPADMEEAILLGAEGVEHLLDPLTRDSVCLLPPEAVRLAPVVTEPGRILCIGALRPGGKNFRSASSAGHGGGRLARRLQGV